jgi:hypothetical protein
MLGIPKISERKVSWMCSVVECCIVTHKNQSYFPFFSLGVSSPTSSNVLGNLSVKTFEAIEQNLGHHLLSSATRVTTIETKTASHPASHDDQGRSSRWQPNGDDHPFPVQEATEQVSHPLHPAIFVAQ